MSFAICKKYKVRLLLFQEVGYNFIKPEASMKRREFVDQLTKISLLNNQVIMAKEMPLFCCRQSKINSRKLKQQSTPNPSNIHLQSSSFAGNKAVVIIKERVNQRISSAFQQREDGSREVTGKRMLTSPSPSLLKQRRTERELQYALSMQSPTKKDTINSIPHKSQWKTLIKRDSFTETSEVQTQPPTATSRSVYLSNLSLRKHTNSNLFQRDRVASQLNQGQSVESKPYASNSRRKGGKITVNVRKEMRNNKGQEYLLAPPKITSKSHIIYQIKSNPSQSKVIYSFNSRSSQEVASLTKIMTCILTIDIARSLQLDKHTQQVLIGKMEASMGGTTADLEPGQVYTVQQLLYGLMLPSGNDASVALAVWAGRQLIEHERQATQTRSGVQRPQKRMRSTISCLSTTTKSNVDFPKKRDCYNRFLREMNAKARELNMGKTTYANSHGLVNQNNKSSAYDIAILCDYAMRNQQFRSIVQTSNYRTTITFNPHHQGLAQQDTLSDEESLQGQIDAKSIHLARSAVHYQAPKKSEIEKALTKISIQWENTHKLLHLKPDQYIGIKTGYTIMAGPCLCSCLAVQGRQFIIVVLSCAKMGLRFKETEALKKWIFRRQGICRRNLVYCDEADKALKQEQRCTTQQINQPFQFESQTNRASL